MKLNRYPFKPLLFLFFTGIWLYTPFSTGAQVCSNPNTLFAIDNTAKLYPVDPTNATVGAVINNLSYTVNTSYTTLVPGQTSAPSSPNGLGYNSVNGKFYYFKRDPGGASKQFDSYDPVLNLYTTLATTPITVSVHSACINFNGLGYYCLDVNSNLYYYDITLNTWTFITSSFTDQFGNNVSMVITSMSTGDMAIDGLDNMWILPSNASNFSLYKLVAPLPTTAVGSITLQQVIPPTRATPSGTSIYGVAFDPSGNLYMSTSAGDLYKMSTPAAAPVLIGTLNPTNMTDLSSCAFPLSVLPVSFTNFTGTEQNNGTNLLNWSIPAQPGGKGFVIEQSTDALNWKQVGFVQCNAFSNTSYSYTDLHPVAGNNFYRLELVNLDGSYVYSKTLELTVKNTDKISVWPNPVTDKLNIHLANNTAHGAFAITYDGAGRAINKTNLQQGINTINMQAFPAGSYTVQVHYQNGDIINEKLVKQ
jgi:hypothetical protein